MDARSGDPAPGGPGLLGQRLRVILLVLVVFGIPLGLMLTYLGTRALAFRPPFDDQPGGAIAGTLVDEEGDPVAGVAVRALLYPRDGAPVAHASVESDAEGRFSFDVPPLDGCYVLRAGGNVWQEVYREISLSDEPADDLELSLRPGCIVAVTLSRRDGSPIRGGEYVLRRSGGFLGLAIPSQVHDEFEAASFERGGLAPGKWTVRVELSTGDTAEYSIELEPGRRELRLDPF